MKIKSLDISSDKGGQGLELWSKLKTALWPNFSSVAAHIDRIKSYIGKTDISSEEFEALQFDSKKVLKAKPGKVGRPVTAPMITVPKAEKAPVKEIAKPFQAEPIEAKPA